MEGKLLKVVVVTPWPPMKTGVSFYSLDLYDEVAKAAEVVIIGSKISDSSNNKNIKIIRGWSPGGLGTFQALRQCLMQGGDIFHIQTESIIFRSILSTFLLPFMILALRLTGRPVVVTLHGIINLASPSTMTYDADNPRLRLYKWVQWFTHFYARVHVMSICYFSSRIIVHNELMKKALVEDYAVKKTKISMIPIGVKKASFTVNAKHDPLVHDLLFLGYLRPSKGVENLITAMERVDKIISNLQLTIAGGAPFEKDDYIMQLLRQVNTLKKEMKIKFTDGVVPYDKVGEYVASSDIIVLPYLDNFLEASMVLGDTMDYGKPIICTRIPRFMGDLIPGKDCLMVQPGDINGLSEAILTLLKNEKLAEMLGLNLKIKAQSRYWNLIAQRLQKEVYEPLVIKSEL